MRTAINTFRLLALATITAVSITSCNQDDDDDVLEVPSTYEFTRDGQSTVDYSGQTDRLNMLSLISTYMKTSNTVGAAALDAQVLKDMFANQNDPFTGATFTKDLRSKCFQPDVALYESYMDRLAASSTATGTASEGVAGVLVEGNTDPTTGYRVDENGVEMIQVIEKGLIGAVFFYQAMEVYLSEDRMGTIGNDALEEGKNYTAMEHYFDEAFGYFGIPVDFPNAATLEDVKWWGNYCNRRNNDLYPGLNSEIATAFRTARAAIVAKDYEARDEAIRTVQEKWAIVCAATAVDYLREGLSTANLPVYQRHHALSEGIGFMNSLKYHFSGGNSKFPPSYNFSHVQEALNILNENTNIYNITDSDLNEAIGHIQMAFPSGTIK
ncbi:MAG: DUF4856 domain-containing protein [Bacteroidetes bacterium]|nr:MAG: DUF4856 domain-containing protein [Bacteroidota bacterium]